MAKMVVHRDDDPAIGIVLGQEGSQFPQGWHGACTECGATYDRWYLNDAVRAALKHVERHESGL